MRVGFLGGIIHVIFETSQAEENNEVRTEGEAVSLIEVSKKVMREVLKLTYSARPKNNGKSLKRGGGEMKKTIKGKISTKKDEKRMTKVVRTGIKAGVCDRDGGSKGYKENPWI